MKYTSNTYKNAINIITNAAKDYKQILSNQNFIFIFKNRNDNSIDYFEAVFLDRNFQHLTGIDFTDTNGKILHKSLYFYKKCLNGKIKENEISYKADGTTELKLKALPLIINFLNSSKMTATYNSFKPKLSVDRLVGTTNFCIGFTKDKDFFVPSSCLLEDIRNLSDVTHQILAIYSKSSNNKKTVYNNLRYIAKGITIEKLNMSDGLKTLIGLSKNNI